MKYLKYFEAEDKFTIEFNKTAKKLKPIMEILGWEVEPWKGTLNINLNLCKIPFSILHLLLIHHKISEAYPIEKKGELKKNLSIYLSVEMPVMKLNSQDDMYSFYELSISKITEQINDMITIGNLIHTVALGGEKNVIEDGGYKYNPIPEDLKNLLKEYINQKDINNIPQGLLQYIIDCINSHPIKFEVLNGIKQHQPIIYSQLEKFGNGTSTASKLGEIGF